MNLFSFILSCAHWITVALFSGSSSGTSTWIAAISAFSRTSSVRAFSLSGSVSSDGHVVAKLFFQA